MQASFKAIAKFFEIKYALDFGILTYTYLIFPSTGDTGTFLRFGLINKKKRLKSN
jgi:hypothetical protein